MKPVTMATFVLLGLSVPSTVSAQNWERVGEIDSKTAPSGKRGVCVDRDSIRAISDGYTQYLWGFCDRNGGGEIVKGPVMYAVQCGRDTPLRIYDAGGKEMGIIGTRLKADTMAVDYVCRGR